MSRVLTLETYAGGLVTDEIGLNFEEIDFLFWFMILTIPLGWMITPLMAFWAGISGVIFLFMVLYEIFVMDVDLSDALYYVDDRHQIYYDK